MSSNQRLEGEGGGGDEEDGGGEPASAEGVETERVEGAGGTETRATGGAGQREPFPDGSRGPSVDGAAPPPPEDMPDGEDVDVPEGVGPGGGPESEVAAGEPERPGVRAGERADGAARTGAAGARTDAGGLTTGPAGRRVGVETFEPAPDDDAAAEMAEGTRVGTGVGRPGDAAGDGFVTPRDIRDRPAREAAAAAGAAPMDTAMDMDTGAADGAADADRETLEEIQRGVDEAGRPEIREQAQDVEATAVRDLSEEFGADLSGADVDVDLVTTPGGERRLRARLTSMGRRKVGAAQLDERLGDFVVTPGDVEVTDGGVRLTQRAQEDFSEFFERQAREFTERLPDIRRRRRQRRRERFEAARGEFRESLEDLSERLPAFEEREREARRAAFEERTRRAEQRRTRTFRGAQAAAAAGAPVEAPSAVAEQLADRLDEDIEDIDVAAEDVVATREGLRFRAGLSEEARKRLRAERNVGAVAAVGDVPLSVRGDLGAPGAGVGADTARERQAGAGERRLLEDIIGPPEEFVVRAPTAPGAPGAGVGVSRARDRAPAPPGEVTLEEVVRAGTGVDVTGPVEFEAPAALEPSVEKAGAAFALSRQAGRGAISAAEDAGDIAGRAAEAVAADLATAAGIEQPGAAAALQEQDRPATQIAFEEIREELREDIEGPADLVAFAEEDVVGAPETGRGRFVAGATAAPGQLVGGIPDVVLGTAEFGVRGAGAAAEGELGEFAAGTAAAGAERGRTIARAVRERPFRTGGAVAGSLPASAGIIGGAARVGGPVAGRAAAFGIQPGEELAISAARAGFVPSRAARAVPGVRKGHIEGAEAAGADATAAAEAAESSILPPLPTGESVGRLRTRIAEFEPRATRPTTTREVFGRPRFTEGVVGLPRRAAQRVSGFGVRATRPTTTREVFGRPRFTAEVVDLPRRFAAARPEVPDFDLSRPELSTARADVEPPEVPAEFLPDEDVTVGRTEPDEGFQPVDPGVEAAEAAAEPRRPRQQAEPRAADVAAEEAQGLLLRQERELDRRIDAVDEADFTLREEATFVEVDEPTTGEVVGGAPGEEDLFEFPTGEAVGPELDVEPDEEFRAFEDVRTELDPRLETRPFETTVEREAERADVRLEEDLAQEQRQELIAEAIAEAQSRAEADIDPTQSRPEDDIRRPGVGEFKDIFEFDVTTPAETAAATVTDGAADAAADVDDALADLDENLDF